ncbi:hypothetical protein V499_03514 [Pseudogymnoascus sp. VKM F-103]|nr:hypothetical protein V499_03514 [Pseudogymnoascus sp. VKM F-103]
MDSLNLRQSIFIALIGLIGYAIVRRVIYSVETSTFKRLHGCKPPTRLPQLDPILGLDLFKTIKQNAVERKALETNVRRSLTVARTMTINLMGQTFVSTCEPENVKSILATNFDDFVVGPRMSAMGRLMGRGIFTTDGVHWEHSRALIRPSFTRAQVADLDSIETHVQNLIKKLPEDGGTVDMQHLFFNFTIDNATEFLLGRSINCQTDPSMEYFSEAWDYAESRSNDRLRLGKLAFLMRDAKFESSCDIVHSVVDNYIAEFLSTKKGGAALGSGDVKAKRYNLLSELSAVCSDPIQLRNELLNVLLAARDTTAGLLSSIMYFLARSPEVWRKLVAEVDDLGGELPNYDTLKRMRYLRAVLDETLRLHPPVPLNMRFASRHTTIPRGGGPDGKSPVFIAKGTALSYGVWTMHRLPEVYGSNAEDFHPGRWLDSEKPLRPGWAYLPFNGGPRICLGQQSALMEAGYVVTRLVQSFKQIEPRGGVFRENLALTFSHFGGVKVALWRR